MRSLRLLVLVVALVAASCGGSASDDRTTAGPTTTEDPSTVEDSTIASTDAGLTGLTAELADIRIANAGRLPLEDAIDFFASTFGAIPGGDADRFVGRPGDGTMAMLAIGAHWDELTSEQQQAVRRNLGYSTAQSIRAPMALDATALQAAADSARSAIAGLVGTDLGFPIIAEQVPELTVDGRRVAGVAIPERHGDFVTFGRPDACRVRFPVDPAPNATTVAHEVFHCFQFQIAPDLDDVFASQAWIVEGSAEWAGATVGGVDGGAVDHFVEWRSNTGSLFGLDYSAIGFYWVVESMGQNPWSVIDDMLAVEGLAAVAATGLDPSDVLNRVATSLARSQHAPTIPVSDVWDFAVAAVPPHGTRTDVTVSPDHPFDEQQARSDFARGGIPLITIEGGERVEVRVVSDTGTIEFHGKDAVEWQGSLHQEFCLEEGGCRCGVDGEVDPGLGEGTRQLIIGAGALGGGPITYLVRVPDPAGAFTDGHWEGTITSSVFVVSTDGSTGARHETTAGFEFTIASGAVTGGSYSVGYHIDFTQESGAHGEGTSTITGTFVGCGFSPQLIGSTFGLDAVLIIPDVGPVPLQFEEPIVGGIAGAGTVWVVDPVGDPNRRTGAIDLASYVQYLRDSGYGASDVTMTFEATRTG